MNPNTDGKEFSFMAFDECCVYYSRADRLWLWSAYKDAVSLSGCEPSKEMALMSLAGEIVSHYEDGGK